MKVLIKFQKSQGFLRELDEIVLRRPVKFYDRTALHELSVRFTHFDRLIGSDNFRRFLIPLRSFFTPSVKNALAPSKLGWRNRGGLGSRAVKRHAYKTL